jgi:hypothetical protein
MAAIATPASTAACCSKVVPQRRRGSRSEPGRELGSEGPADPAQGTHLLPVAKASPLLADAEALWQRAFEAAFGGPEAAREQLKNLPPAQRKDIVRAVSASGYPAPETLDEFRTLVAEPILHAPARPHAVQGTTARRPRPRKPHRR